MAIFHNAILKAETMRQLAWLRQNRYDVKLVDDLTFEVVDTITGKRIGETHKKLAQTIDEAYASLDSNRF